MLLACVLFYERRPLRSIGLAKRVWKSLAWGAGGAAVMVAGTAFSYLVIFPAPGRLANGNQMDEGRLERFMSQVRADRSRG